MGESEFAQLKERFDYLSERQSADHTAVNCPADKLVELCIALRNDFGYDLLVDLTAVDWDAQSPRFTGMYHLCLLYTSPSPRDGLLSRMPSSA